MIKVTALTSSPKDPSSRYRIRQYIEPLKNFGIEVKDYGMPLPRYRRQPLATLGVFLRVPGVLASRQSDITWIRRELIPERFTLERFTGGRRIFEVDDSIWLLRDSGFSERIVELCDGVIAGNSRLAEHYAGILKRIWIVPTAVDTDHWQPIEKDEKDEWIVGWIGTGYNLRYLKMIEEPLAEFLASHKNTRLRIISDEVFNSDLISPDSMEFIKWSEAVEVHSTQTMDVGLMPLDDTEWTRGKCGGKMVTYLAAGIPVIVSPVGVNADILAHGELGFGAATSDEWFHALETLYNNRRLAEQMGITGRDVIEEHYSIRANAPKIADIFKEILSI
ncbi:MAG: glycosyltransferase family 4 protein [Pyrinomonadaceae bacterium]